MDFDTALVMAQHKLQSNESDISKFYDSPVWKDIQNTFAIWLQAELGYLISAEENAPSEKIALIRGRCQVLSELTESIKQTFREDKNNG